jgi:putative SOS response-associated peptidase YedK
MPVWEAPEDEGDGAPRSSYNFAPGYYGVVYRADVPDWGAGPSREHRSGAKAKNKSSHGKGENSNVTEAYEVDDAGIEASQSAEARTNGKPDQSSDQPKDTHYILQSMKWGLIPFWTKRSPDYASVLRTINCRDDSLATPGGMWSSMKARKRCIVIAQGFYEWLKPGGKEKVPHYVCRKDGKLMCFAGLWDCVVYEDDEGREPAGDNGVRKNYTYTIITTDPNKQMRFLHDRMPVILDQGSDALRTWLDPGRYEWSPELQRLLKPFEGELDIYPVSKEVGKVGNNSPSFIIPVASKENKNNIANFFASAEKSKSKVAAGVKTTSKVEPETEVEENKIHEQGPGNIETEIETETKPLSDETAAVENDEVHSTKLGFKRSAPDMSSSSWEEPPIKKNMSTWSSPSKEKQQQGRPKISATSNTGKSPMKSKGKGKPIEAGSQKITKFFANSS